MWPDQKLGEVLKIFLKNRSHMAIVRDVNNTGAVSSSSSSISSSSSSSISSSGSSSGYSI